MEHGWLCQLHGDCLIRTTQSECLPLEEGECHPVSVDSTAYNLTHIFRDPGDYCFSIQAENVISKTHQYHKIQVWPSSK